MSTFAGEGVSWRNGIVPTVVQQHSEEAAVLWQLRSVGTKQANFSLMYLERFDRRLDAHLDGLAVAGTDGWRFCEAALENPSAAAVFPASVLAILDGQQAALDRLFALTGAVPESRAGLISAFGWCEPVALQGVVARLLASEIADRRMVGVAACALHGVDPGVISRRLLEGSDAQLLARALRTAGVVGKQDLESTCLDAIRHNDPEVRFWAAWSAVLLGDRGAALDALIGAGAAQGAHSARAFRLALQSMKMSSAHRVLQDLTTVPKQLRSLIRGAGFVGDSTYVPWLIGHMEKNEAARIAGEAFSLITGIDLALLDLERKPPENFESGPNDDPDDPNVEMDDDDGLQWPDSQKIEKWWAANENRFQKGTRYFMGAPVTREHCIEVLKNGYQRQRILAAHYLCLLDPGTPLFNTSAPAWRQQRLLAKMS